MKNMKKIINLLILLLLAVSCLAFMQSCNGNQQDNVASIGDVYTDLNSQSTIQQIPEQNLSSDEPTYSSTPETTTTTTTQKTTTTTKKQQTVSTPETDCWVSGSVVNFRAEPNTDGEVLASLGRGTKIVKLGKNGDWIYARYGKLTGYIHSDYVSTSPPPATEKGKARIVVKKSLRILELWQGNSLVGSYSIGLGWNPVGHKQVEGDGKTPEGEYYVCFRNGNSKFYKALGVSYPNKSDAAAALADGRIDQSTYNRIARAIDRGECPDWYTALGGNILIHGLGGTSDWTAGCVGVDNDVMDILYDYCPMGTRITILP